MQFKKFKKSLAPITIVSAILGCSPFDDGEKTDLITKQALQGCYLDDEYNGIDGCHITCFDTNMNVYEQTGPYKSRGVIVDTFRTEYLGKFSFIGVDYIWKESLRREQQYPNVTDSNNTEGLYLKLDGEVLKYLPGPEKTSKYPYSSKKINNLKVCGDMFKFFTPPNDWYLK